MTAHRYHMAPSGGHDDDALVDKMREKRIKEGYSLRRLAPVIGLSFSTLARIERGDGGMDCLSRSRIGFWLEGNPQPHYTPQGNPIEERLSGLELSVETLRSLVLQMHAELKAKRVIS